MSAKLSLILYQGSTYKLKFTLQVLTNPVDLTGASISFEIQPQSGGPKIYYSLANYITCPTPANGIFNLILPPSETATFDWTRANYVLDVTFTDNTVKRYLYGVIINKGI